MGFGMAVRGTIGIIVYGVRKNHDQPPWKALLKWGTIATAVYLICLPFVALTIYA
jgi:hypothetical protein